MYTYVQHQQVYPELNLWTSAAHKLLSMVYLKQLLHFLPVLIRAPFFPVPSGVQ